MSNKLNIIKELLNHYSKNHTGEDFVYDLTNVRKDGAYSDDELINIYLEDVFEEMKKIYPGPADIMTMYWWHKGRTALEEIPKIHEEREMNKTREDEASISTTETIRYSIETNKI